MKFIFLISSIISIIIGLIVFIITYIKANDYSTLTKEVEQWETGTIITVWISVILIFITSMI